jgi:uridine phosphorylase
MQKLNKSEFILNPRGAVYHLNLKPGELATTVITVGDPDRVSSVSRYFDRIDYRFQHREFTTHTGWIGDRNISVVSTGIGTDNIDIVMNELDALVNIDFKSLTPKQELQSLQIIRIGTSGSLSLDIPCDSFVASTHGLGIDNLLNFYRFEHNAEERQLLQAFVTQTQLSQSISSPYIFSASPALLKHFVDDFHHGITVTCPGFYGPQGRILRLGLKNPDLIGRLTQFRFGQHTITNFEMETAGIYGLGKLLGHQCLSLSAIVANRIKKEFSRDTNALMIRLIERSLEIIQTIKP